MRSRALAFLLLASTAALTPSPALAVKDCRSRLSTGLNSIGSTGLSWNFELRGSYYGVDGSGYKFPGLGAWLRYELSSAWSFDLEATLKEKIALDYDRPELSPVQLKTAAVRYRDPRERFDLTLGRQEVQLADGLILDEFLDAVQIDLRSGRIDLRAGAGVLALSAAKESLYCSKCLFFEYRSCWKGFGESAYGDFRTAYIQASMSFGSGSSAGLLYQKIDAAETGYDSDTAGVFARIALPFRWRLSLEGAIQKQALHDTPALGYHLDLYRSWRIGGLGTLQVRWQDLFGSSDGSLAFSPTFGNIHLGDRQHYSVRQGHTSGIGLKLIPEFYKRMTLSAAYWINGGSAWTDWTTDEADAGMEWRPFGSDRVRFYLNYARAVTRTGIVHQTALEIRISF